MDNLHFELIPFRSELGAGRRGLVEGFGEVTILRPAESRKRREGPTASRVVVMGSEVPDLAFRGRGAAIPALDMSTLHVDGFPVVMKRNPFGIRPKSRALQLEHRGRMFSYIYFGVGKGSELQGDSVKVALNPGRHIRKTGVVTQGVVSGALDALTLALAVVFEEVDTSSLTLAGAASMMPIRFISYNGPTC